MYGILCLIFLTHLRYNQQLLNQESFTKLFKHLAELSKASKELDVQFPQFSENICAKNMCKEWIGI